MKRILSWTVFLSFCLLAASVGPLAQSRSEFVDGNEAVPGEALVKFRAVSRGAIDQVIRDQNIDVFEELAPLGWYRVHSTSQSAGSLIRNLNARPEVEAAEANWVLRADENTNLIPNDPSFPQLWGLMNTGQVIGGVAGKPDADIDAELAWNTTTGSNSIAVGVVDTGVDYTHPDLALNAFTSTASYTVTLGGVPVTCPIGSHGVNAITNGCDPRDDNDHGSHVSGTIGAVGNNALGVVGVNWRTTIVGLKFLSASGSGSTADAIEAINAGTDMKRQGVANIRVSSNSWGGGGFSTPLSNAISRAIENNILFVAAAGNNGTNNDVTPHYPSSYPQLNLIAVAATNNLDKKASFSNFGKRSVDLGAPGVAILSTIRNGNYAMFNGTSMATPHVSGAAALVLSACGGSLATGQLRQAILSSVDPIGLGEITVTGGRLNVNSAISAACTP
jgi:subtilisin family serine protease